MFMQTALAAAYNTNRAGNLHNLCIAAPGAAATVADAEAERLNIKPYIYIYI